MSKYRCTVEYRVNNGSILHQTQVLDAESAESATEMARQGWLGRHEPGPDGEPGIIEEIVCYVDSESAH